MYVTFFFFTLFLISRSECRPELWTPVRIRIPSVDQSEAVAAAEVELVLSVREDEIIRPRRAADL